MGWSPQETSEAAQYFISGLVVSRLLLASSGMNTIAHSFFYESGDEVHLAAVKLIGEIKDSPSSLAKCQPVYTKVQPAICSLHSPYRHMEIGQQKAIKKLYSLPGSIKKKHTRSWV